MSKPKNRKKQWYYVSFYQKRYVYEPAEGGYYYPVIEMIESYRFKRLNKARNFAKNWVDTDMIVYIETVMGKHESGYVSYC